MQIKCNEIDLLLCVLLSKLILFRNLLRNKEMLRARSNYQKNTGYMHLTLTVVKIF